MTVDANVDMKADRLFYLGTSLIYKCVCAPKAWTADQVSDEATKADPPGTSANRWVASSPDDRDDDCPFKNGNPQPCNDDTERRHWWLNC